MTDLLNNLFITLRSIAYYAAWVGSIWAVAWVVRPAIGC